MNQPRRTYQSLRRRAQAEATRDRVLKAALELLVERGYAETTIEAIAVTAQVGVRTVYDSFGSKSGILRGLLESFGQIPRADFESRVYALAADPDAQLGLATRFVADYFAAAQPLLDLMRTSAGLEPALAAAEREGEALRRASQRVMVRNWLDRGVLRPELGAATTADILWALTGPAMYQMLVKDRRWSKRRYRDWLHRSLRELLFRSAITR
jgi:AcrR family transcriptional regulator